MCNNAVPLFSSQTELILTEQHHVSFCSGNVFGLSQDQEYRELGISNILSRDLDIEMSHLQAFTMDQSW